MVDKFKEFAMSTAQYAQLQPDEPGLWTHLSAMSSEELDELAFGVIRFGADFIVDRYNLAEMQYTGLRREQALGAHVFTQLAQCMNNWLVAQRFEDSMASGEPLDTWLDYTLTWRMRPTPVRLRLLWQPGGQSLGFIALQRTA